MWLIRARVAPVMLACVVLTLAVLGWYRGLVAQLTSVVALLAGVWCGVAVKQWVGAHWQGAHPAVVFWALSWLVSLLVALTVVSLIQAAGNGASRWVDASHLAWLDRTLGIAAGAALGVVLACLLVLAAIRLPMGFAVDRGLDESRTTRSLLSIGADLCRQGHGFPGAPGLRREFLSARQRPERLSASILLPRCGS